MALKRIAILGSTGSVGQQALEVVAAGEGLSVCALASGGNWKLLAEQARRFKPEAVAIADAEAVAALKPALPAGTAVYAGADGMTELVRKVRPGLLLTAMVGASGLMPTLEGIACGADLAVANKESLVMAGAIIVPAARKAGVRILPVDSEHSAVFQCLVGHRRQDVRRVILTASGGPFRTWSAERIRAATLAEVLHHPTWQMGRKITIDSATLINKALEIIEAHWLFGLAPEQIQVLIHPESLVHAMVEFHDGSLLAQMGTASMATPIAYALHYPRRAPQAAAPLEMSRLAELHFEPADPERFPALRLGYDVVARGGTAGAALNAANETAVEAFVAGSIGFGAIVEIVREVVDLAPASADVSLETILAADRQARRQALRIIERERTAAQP